MKQQYCTQNSLPQDIALKIASLLQVRDLCALACCSRFWREICSSECIWESLARQRWPFLRSLAPSSASTSSDPVKFKEWRKSYISRHNELAGIASVVAKFLEDLSLSGSLEVVDYLKAVKELSDLKFGFEDIKMFLFKRKLNVLLNLVGVQFCFTCLGIQGDSLLEALDACGISDRHVCIKLWNTNRWFFGFRMMNESHSRWVSLADLATEHNQHMLAVLQYGAIHEVLRIQISAVHHT